MGEFDDIRSAADVDAEWLTVVLQHAGIGIDDEIVAVSASSIGTGQVGDNVRFELTWVRGRENGAAPPRSVVGKFPSQSEVSRSTAVNVGTYVRETGFYRDLRPHVGIATPEIHHVGWNPDTHDFVLVMEDVRGAEQGDQLAGCDLYRAELAVDEAIGLHAPTWGRTEELRHHDWLGFPDDERAEFMAAMMQWALPGFTDRFAGRLTADDLAVGAALVERFRNLTAATAEWVRGYDGACVVHGDYRLDNMLFGVDPSDPGTRGLTVVDWQTVTVGTGPSDIAYFCGAGLRPHDRSRHERDLVARYSAGLRAAGVSVSDEAIWDGYVLGSAGGYLMAVLASQIVEQTERGDEMFAVMAERHAAQIRHVGLLDRL